MGLLSGLIERRSGYTFTNPPENFWGSPGTISSDRVTPATALGLDTVWACVTLLARSIGQMPLIVYQGEGRNRERAKKTWQWELLHESPNPSWQPDAFVEDIVALENLWGNWYAEKVKIRHRSRDIVGEMWRIAPNKVQVTVRDDGSKVFEIDNEPRSYTSDEIIHIPGFGYDGRTGLSPIAVHRLGLANASSRRNTAGDFYANAALPSGILKTEKALSPDAAKTLKARWDAAHSGSKRGGTAVLEDGLTWQQVSIPMVEQQYVEQERFSVNQICRMFQVPPEKVGGDRSSSMTYSNVESANLDFVIFSLQHWMVRIEQGFKHDKDLFPEGLGLYPEFLAEGLLRSDPLGRAEFYSKMAGVEAITREEIRERENLGPVKDGDHFPNMPGAAPTNKPEPAAAEPQADTNGHGPPARVAPITA